MKTNKLISFFMMYLAISTLFVRCGYNQQEEDITGLSGKKGNFPSVLYNAYVNGVKLPNGTKAELVDDSTVKFIYPKGVRQWVFDQNQNFARVMELSDGSYTCTCSGSNGCNVFYTSQTGFGCSHGECSGSCTGKNNRFNEDAYPYYAFIDRNMPLSPITDEKDFKNLPYIPELVLKDKEVQKLLAEYAFKIYGDKYTKILDDIDSRQVIKNDIEDIIYIQMKIYGYKFIYGMDFKKLKDGMKYNNDYRVMEISDGGFSCHCDSGSSGCTKGSSLGVKYCEGGGCTQCTMKI